MSKLDQLATRPATMSLSTRVDMRHLATLVAFWRAAGEQPRSISELSRLSLESFAEMLVTSHLVEFVDSHEAATELLYSTGMMTKGVQRTNLLEALIKDGKVDASSLTQASDPLAKLKLTKKVVVGSQDSPELLQAQALLDKKLANDLKDQITSSQSRTQGMFEALGEIPPIE